MAHAYADIEARFSAAGQVAVTVSGAGGDASARFDAPAVPPFEQLAREQGAASAAGRALFAALFHTAARDVYQASLARLRPGEQPRLLLSIPADLPGVAALPWELLDDPARGPLALGGVAVTRFLALPIPRPELADAPALRVLLSAAQTPPPAPMARELRAIADALAEHPDRIEATEALHLTAAELREHLRAGFHVWHFVGHGGPDAGAGAQLLFEDAYGDAAPVPPPELAALLAANGVRLAVLSACHSAGVAAHVLGGVAPSLVAAGVPTVVAMQAEVSAEATRAFAGAFYSALAAGQPVERCVAEGRAAILGASPGSCDWATPAVYTRLRDAQVVPAPAAPAPGAISVGSIHGALVNVGGVATVTGGMTVHMGDDATAAPAARGAPDDLVRAVAGADLEALAGELRRQLDAAPPAQAELAARLRRRADVLLGDARAERPDRDLLLYNARSLLQLLPPQLAAEAPALYRAAACLAAWFEGRTN